jgi:hypothetical protein
VGEDGCCSAPSEVFLLYPENRQALLAQRQPARMFPHLRWVNDGRWSVAAVSNRQAYQLQTRRMYGGWITEGAETLLPAASEKPSLPGAQRQRITSPKGPNNRGLRCEITSTTLT